MTIKSSRNSLNSTVASLMAYEIDDKASSCAMSISARNGSVVPKSLRPTNFSMRFLDRSAIRSLIVFMLWLSRLALSPLVP